MNPSAKIISIFATLCLIFLTISCRKEAFEIGTEVHDTFYVKNNDYLIPVKVRGNTGSKKIILFVTGGPGSNTFDFAEVDYPGWKNTLEKEFALAYYEQRGTGNSQGNFDFGENIYETYTEDLHKAAAFLKKAYDAEIILMGHSFGGRLVYEYMIRYGQLGIPGKYISASGPATTDAAADTLRWKFRRSFLYNTANLEISRNTRVNEWEAVLQWLSATPEIKKVEGDYPYKLMDQWNSYVENLVYSNYGEKSPAFRDYVKVIFCSTYNPFPSLLNGTYRDKIVSLFAREDKKGYDNGSQLMNRLKQIDTQSVLLLTGKYDDVCPPEELDYIYKQIPSTQKRIEIIDYAGHELFTHQPIEFYNQIKSFIQQ